VTLITVYGVVALSFMMVMYGLERRGRMFILAFLSVACFPASMAFSLELGHSGWSRQSGAWSPLSALELRLGRKVEVSTCVGGERSSPDIAVFGGAAFLFTRDTKRT
jgi:hypothetical protein